MSLNSAWLRRFVEWADRFGFAAGDAMLDVGASELICSDDPASINAVVARFGGVPFGNDDLCRLANNGNAGEMFLHAGLRYTSIDYAKAPHCMLLDLNRDSLPNEHIGRYKFVSNSGTSEHVLNQYNTFNVIHDATMKGGIMYHGLPMCGEFEHGLFNYNAKFFWALAKANRYDIVKFWGSAEEKVSEIPPSFLTQIEFSRPPCATNASLHILLRRTSTAPFRGLIDPAFLPN